jgi:hypothetical protein
MEGMGNEYPCSARSTVEEYIVEDRLANMGVKSGEGILEPLSYFYDVIVLDHSHRKSECPIPSKWRDKY